MDTFGSRLRAERKRLGFNQADLAAIGNVSRKTQGIYEDDQRSPDALYLRAIAEVGADVSFLVNGERSVQRLPMRQATLLDLVSEASSDQQDMILRVVRAVLGEEAVSTKPADNLPRQSALAEMFEALLVAIDLPDETRAEIADLLADMLPVGLRQLEDLLPEEPTVDQTDGDEAVPPAAAAPPAPRRARRT